MKRVLSVLVVLLVLGMANGALAASKQLVGVININTATVEQLKQLNGIGEVKAKRIVQYRKERGAFKTPAAIRYVNGIGDALYLKNKAYIVVTGQTTLRVASK
ncbi:MAG: ComE operon protein 1 [Deltaproteobacteria bacterium ADurb.Bin510]|nr:MAG: ComE operon protein 1 [Deltaproteobacteria bacterium ADurb.Bin510]